MVGGILVVVKTQVRRGSGCMVLVPRPGGSRVQACVVVVGCGVKDFVVCVATGAGGGVVVVLVFVEMVVGVGGKGVFGLIVVIVVGVVVREGMCAGVGGGSDAGKEAVAAVEEEVFDRDEGGG